MKIRNLFPFFFIILFSFYSFSQYNGSTPWDNCFGKNAECKYVGCSDIKVNASSSPVLVIVKKFGKVIKHAYVSSNNSYTFEVSDGTYQVFFYYGKNWSSTKKMNSGECSYIYGGWIDNEYVSKDNPITLKGQIMTYTLTEVTYGNFSPKSSTLNEAL
jgi:hypothetical protein